ncbi:hypothetical protein [Franzmannia qiaohouensis]|uniref:Uncharacterized protein n=1 Tax=Franzmannia qiaohouensis TaxID=1329370 RepID=A0ABU1HAE0_9GAMM|nr:hypothetical protein [Halomonas qiaohouensis]MDR5903764.1 hypothetical protein [Halomonas qiaohouensis]
MRQFLFPRAPLARATLLSCHLLLQIGLVASAMLWLAPRTPWLSGAGWAEAWPTLALGSGALLLAMVALRLLAELWLLPYHLGQMRGGFAPSAVVTRSFERRPAVHDSQEAWTSQAREMHLEEGAVGTARVARPRRRGVDEPTLDLAAGAAPEAASRQEPHL